MKKLVSALVLMAFICLVGCGKDDTLNKDLKPIDPNAPKPVQGSDGQGEKQKLDKPSPAVQ